MKVLVTGASGKLGAFIIRDLAQDYDLVLMSRRRPDPEFAAHLWIEGDLADFETCQRAVAGVEAIQHLGAQPWPVDHPAMREWIQEQGLPFDATFKTKEQRTQMAATIKPVEGWSPWLWSWVASEDVASAHRLLMEKAADLETHGVYFLNADDTSTLEPSAELVERFRPDLGHLARKLSGHQSFISNAKLKQAVAWQPQISWRVLL